jgi:O-antigen/teichoic acid export membrane protein
VQKGLGFLLFLALAQMLTASEYATFGLMYALQAGISTFAMAGIVETTVSKMKSNTETAQRLVVFGQSKFLFAVIAAAAIVVGGASFAIMGQISPLSILVAISFGGMSALVTIQAQLARLQEDHATTLVIANIPQVCGILAAGVAAYQGFAAQVIFLAMAAGLLMGYLLVSLFWGTSASSWKKPAKLGASLLALGPFLGIAIFDWLAGYGSLFLVEASFSDMEVARFAFAYTLSSLMHLVATSLNQIWSPRIYAELRNKDSSAIYASSRIFYILQGVCLGIMGCAIITGVSTLAYFENLNLQNYQNMIFEVLFLLLAYACVIPWYYAQNFFYYNGEGTHLLKITLISGISGLALWFASVSLLGPIGSYVGFFALMATKSALGAFSAWRKWKVPVAWEGAAISLVMMTAYAYFVASFSGQN